ncbi:MAG: thioredoxin family protein [Syntrophorhabdaceae bacterium]|nr:thioredoxin family protein [Syntrophorhabdaceae bacterium]
MKIQILGTGCAKCIKLAENAEQAAREKGVPFELEKITDINKIMDFGVMFTPGLAIDGQVKSVGKVLSVEEIKKML